MHKALAAIVCVVCCAGEVQAATYYVAPGRMSAELRVAGDGKPELLGQFNVATASFDYDEASHALNRLRVAVDGDSLTSSNYVSERELASMLEPDSYREIALVSLGRVVLSDGKAESKGLLTLRGVTKPVTIQTIASTGDGGVGVSLKVEAKRVDFGIGDDPDEDRTFGNALILGMDMRGLRQ